MTLYSECCNRVVVQYDVKNDAFKRQSHRYTTYEIQSELVNGRAYYKSSDGNAIAYNSDERRWFIQAAEIR